MHSAGWTGGIDDVDEDYISGSKRNSREIFYSDYSIDIFISWKQEHLPKLKYGWKKTVVCDGIFSSLYYWQYYNSDIMVLMLTTVIRRDEKTGSSRDLPPTELISFFQLPSQKSDNQYSIIREATCPAFWGTFCLSPSVQSSSTWAEVKRLLPEWKTDEMDWK